MKKYEYVVKTPPTCGDGNIFSGYKKQKSKNIFGKEVISTVEICMEEEEWLNSMGMQGFELVAVNGIKKSYYFKREL
jgi:hypothetical protein